MFVSIVCVVVLVVVLCFLLFLCFCCCCLFLGFLLFFAGGVLYNTWDLSDYVKSDLIKTFVMLTFWTLMP